MFVGILEIEIFIPGSNSLKEKRQVLKSVQDKIRNKFNVSITEVDFHDKWQRAVLGIALANHSGKMTEELLERIKDIIKDNNECLLINEKKHIFTTNE